MRPGEPLGQWRASVSVARLWWRHACWWFVSRLLGLVLAQTLVQPLVLLPLQIKVDLVRLPGFRQVTHQARHAEPLVAFKELHHNAGVDGEWLQIYVTVTAHDAASMLPNSWQIRSTPTTFSPATTGAPQNGMSSPGRREAVTFAADLRGAAAAGLAATAGMYFFTTAETLPVVFEV
jgi:hypothetical protein